MSRRFGRNQRRRMREALVEAQQTTSSAVAVAAQRGRRVNELVDEARDLRTMLDEIADRVGRYAIAAGVPHNFEARWLQRGKGRFQMDVPPDMPSMCTFGNSMDMTMRFYDETMRLLEVEAVRDDFARQMHCRVTFDEHAIGYAISDHALRNMTAKEIERRIAPEIARLLVAELKGKTR